MKSWKPAFKSKLDAYAALSGDNHAGGPGSHKHWVLYATAAGSSLAMSTAAEASIIHQTVNQTASIPEAGGYASNGIIVSINGVNFGVGLESNYIGATFPRRIGAADVFAFSGGAVLSSTFREVVRNLSSGQKISAGAKAFGSGDLLGYKSRYSPIFPVGAFVAGLPALVGIEANGDLGWLRVEFNNNASGYPNTVTLIDWAYNDVAGDPIDAGELPVPEPSSAAIMLTLLAGGAVGLRSWRKQRQTLAAPDPAV